MNPTTCCMAAKKRGGGGRHKGRMRRFGVWSGEETRLLKISGISGEHMLRLFFLFSLNRTYHIYDIIGPPKSAAAPKEEHQQAVVAFYEVRSRSKHRRRTMFTRASTESMGWEDLSCTRYKYRIRTTGCCSEGSEVPTFKNEALLLFLVIERLQNGRG